MAKTEPKSDKNEPKKNLNQKWPKMGPEKSKNWAQSDQNSPENVPKWPQITPNPGKFHPQHRKSRRFSPIPKFPPNPFPGIVFLPIFNEIFSVPNLGNSVGNLGFWGISGAAKIPF